MNSNELKEKNWDLGVILSITSGRLFTDMANIEDIISFLTSELGFKKPLGLLETPIILRDYILSIYPQLEGIGVDVEINSKEDAINFVEEQKKLLGRSLPLSPMSKEYLSMTTEEKEKNVGKEFTLATILNFTTGRLFTSMDDIEDFMDYITRGVDGDLGLVRSRKYVSEYILSIYPQLEGIGVDTIFNSPDEVMAFIEEQKKIFGNSFRLQPMPKDYIVSFSEPNTGGPGL